MLYRKMTVKTVSYVKLNFINFILFVYSFLLIIIIIISFIRLSVDYFLVSVPQTELTMTQEICLVHVRNKIYRECRIDV